MMKPIKRMAQTTNSLTRFRSGLERKGARQLELSGLPFTYETDKIDFVKPAKNAKYCPDFVLTKRDGSKMYIEFKGQFDTADRQKHLLIKDQHPDLDIRIVFQRAKNRIGKTSNTTYAKWATSKGFKWADGGVIPKEWLDECTPTDEQNER